MDFPAHRVTRGGKPIDLTPKEFALLSLLARRSGEVLSRTRIGERIWDIGFESDTNVVDVHMRRLRLKVDDPFEKSHSHGAGDRLCPRTPLKAMLQSQHHAELPGP